MKLYDFPFGEVHTKSVVLGSGAECGLTLFKDNGKFILDHMMNEVMKCSSIELKCLGLEKSKCEQFVVVKLNGRKLSIADMEHFLCKLHIIRQRSHSCRSISLKPRLTEAHLHPVLFPVGIDWPIHVYKYFIECTEAFEYMVDHNKLPPLNKAFYLRSEKEMVTKI